MSHCHHMIAQLRQKGYRITPQREMVIETIAHSGRHMAAEEVFEAIQTRSQAVNVATVYRTLDLLVEEGLASRADLGGGRVVYATLKHGPHVHLVCRHCGCVIDAEVEPFEPLFESIEERHGFVCSPQHFAIYGFCAACRFCAAEDRFEDHLEDNE
ncbi:MAG: transcriptional repressor [Chloroflexi bacterium]|nr:MAG: transcriptional repressor [Chloroflexota bacterium]